MGSSSVSPVISSAIPQAPRAEPVVPSSAESSHSHRIAPSASSIQSINPARVQNPEDPSCCDFFRDMCHTVGSVVFGIFVGLKKFFMDTLIFLHIISKPVKIVITNEGLEGVSETVKARLKELGDNPVLTIYKPLLEELVKKHGHTFDNEVDLRKLDVIPDPLSDDWEKQEWLCGCDTTTPIRNLRIDPTGPNLAPYELKIISKWLNGNGHGRSPLTRAELSIFELVQNPVIQKKIDERLTYHSEVLTELVRCGVLANVAE
jgi:hypothetical protein